MRPQFCKGPIRGCFKEFTCIDCENATTLYLKVAKDQIEQKEVEQRDEIELEMEE